MSKAYGLAHRGFGIPNDVDTRFATASGTKGLTALAVVSLDRGRADSSCRPRPDPCSGEDLPLIDDDVTIEHLLAHRSGIGDYLDEDAGDFELSDYLMPVPVHELATTEDYLAVLDGHPTKFAPGERFAYCNGGYVVLALIAERAERRAVPRRRACSACASRQECATRRSCARTSCPAAPRWAISRSTACGGATCSTCRCAAAATAASTRPSATSSSFWKALFAGRIVSPDWVREMVSPAQRGLRTAGATGSASGFTPTTDAVMLEGCDAGVSFRSVHDPSAQATYTVISNTTDGAWPICRFLEDRLG